MTSISWVFMNFIPQTWRKAPGVVICSLRSTLVWLPHCQPIRINWNHALRGVAWLRVYMVKKMCQDVARYNELRDDVLSWNGASHIPLILLMSVFSFKFVTLFPLLEIHGAWLTSRFPRAWPGVCSSSWWATDLQFLALAFFPFLCRMDRCQKRTSEVWLVIWGPDRRSGEVADLQAQYVPIFFLQTVRVALVLGHPRPANHPWKRQFSSSTSMHSCSGR